jgi:hypothetical protein
VREPQITVSHRKKICERERERERERETRNGEANCERERERRKGERREMREQKIPLLLNGVKQQG